MTTKTLTEYISEREEASLFATESKTLVMTDGALTVVTGKPKTQISAQLDFYVRTDGSDSNTGLANTAGGAFLTIQKAVDTIVNGLDLNTMPWDPNDYIDTTHCVKIHVADGTYTVSQNIIMLSPVTGARGDWMLQIIGNPTTPGNVIINGTKAGFACYGGTWLIDGFKIDMTSVANNSIAVRAASWAGRAELGIINLHIKSGQTGHRAFYADLDSEVVVLWHDSPVDSHVTLEGSFSMVCYSARKSIINFGPRTLTLIGTPAISLAFFVVNAFSQGFFSYDTLEGTATGKLYDVSTNSILTDFDTIPGSVAGTTATGGQFL